MAYILAGAKSLCIELWLITLETAQLESSYLVDSSAITPLGKFKSPSTQFSYTEITK